VPNARATRERAMNAITPNAALLLPIMQRPTEFVGAGA
jgi:hypothetical protein